MLVIYHGGEVGTNESGTGFKGQHMVFFNCLMEMGYTQIMCRN